MISTPPGRHKLIKLQILMINSTWVGEEMGKVEKNKNLVHKLVKSR